MREEYEQLELDTRKELDRAIERVTADAVRNAEEMVRIHTERSLGTLDLGTVHNRHEAYGIAAEQMGRISKAIKSIKDDTTTLLGTLGDPNYPAIEATSSIVNSTMEAAAILIKAAATMKQALAALYDAENNAAQEPTPMEALASGEFAEAESIETENDDSVKDGAESEE